MSDTALRTADSGYLTRRLVDVSQDLIIREIDCAEGKDEIPGMWVSEFTDGKEQIESLQDRITGRFSCETIKDKDGNVIVKANHMITPKRAARVIKDGINENGEHYTKVKIRTILTCRSGNGICAKCTLIKSGSVCLNIFVSSTMWKPVRLKTKALKKKKPS